MPFAHCQVFTEKLIDGRKIKIIEDEELRKVSKWLTSFSIQVKFKTSCSTFIVNGPTGVFINLHQFPLKPVVHHSRINLARTMGG